MEYLRDSFDTGQIKMDFPTPNQSRDIEVHTLPDPENHESSYNLLTQWDPGDKPCNLHSSARKTQVSSQPKLRGVTEFQLKRVVSIPNPNGQKTNQQP